MFQTFTISNLTFNIYGVKILQISSARNFGGGEKHFVDLCRGLINRGHEIFGALRPTNEWENRLDFLAPANILHVSLRNSFGVLSAQKIAEFVGEKNVEIVHAHAARDYIPASLACRIAKTAKFVLTRHVLFPLKPFHRFALGNLSRAIAVSSAVETNLRRTFPAEKIALVQNGIDVENWSKADVEKSRQEFRLEHNIAPEAFLIGTIGELKLLKGQRDFILAAQIVAQKSPAAHFVVAGMDNAFKQDFRRELKRLVKIFRLENHFLWLDWIEDTAPFFSALDIFVSASHTESFGLAILEAMAAGRAIVTTETEGAKELLNDAAGKFVPVKEPIKLAEAINELLKDEEMRERFGKKAQNIAKEKFGLEAMIGRTEKVYRDVLAAKN